MNDTFLTIVSVFNLIVVLVGTIGNAISLVVVFQKPLNTNPSFILLALTFVVNTLSLYFWNLDNFFNLVWDKNVSDIGDVSCKITSFLQFFSTQASAVLLVRIYFYEFSCQIFHNYVLKLVTIAEVLLNIKFYKWRKTYFGFKDAFLTGIAVLSIIYIFNFHIFGTLELVDNNMSCYSLEMFKFWAKVILEVNKN